MQNRKYIFGLHPVIEALKSGKEIDKVFVQKGAAGRLIQELIRLLSKKGIVHSHVPREKLNRLVKGTHQGAVAVLSPVSFVTMEELMIRTEAADHPPLFLLLDRISDARNFGAIIRTAACTGVDGIIIQKQGAAPVNADTVKTSAGAVFKVPICKADHIKDALYYLKSSGITIIAATEKAKNTLYEADFTQPTALIMGSEDKGISPAVLAMADHRTKLPVLGDMDSLNVSVACGAFLYEIVRQRLK